MVSYAGFACALAAAVALGAGAGHALPLVGDRSGGRPASWWPAAAAVLLAVAALADLLDGAVARAAGMQTRFGALLDSTLDRFGDVALFAGCAVYYAVQGNVSLVLVSFLAAASAVQVSYVKARGENLVEGLGVGFWQRGERIVTLLVGCVSGNVATSLCMLALFPPFTVLRRVRLARELLGEDDPRRRRSATPAKLEDLLASLPWRRGRRTLIYWLFCTLITVAIVAGPHVHPFLSGLDDPLGDRLR